MTRVAGVPALGRLASLGENCIWHQPSVIGEGRGISTANEEVVRALFASYLEQDWPTADQLVADGFVFTSPQDDHIDKEAFRERCFPTAERLASQTLLHVTATEGDEVFVMYEYELKSGERHRNAELITVRDGQVVETQVFFGGRYD